MIIPKYINLEIMQMTSIKSAFLNGLGLNAFKKIEHLEYHGYKEDIKNFQKDLRKTTEKFRENNVKKQSY